MDAETVAKTAKLSKQQRAMIARMTAAAMHPFDVCSTGSVGMALVRRGLAYRAVCTMTATDESFNGYGLTKLGLAVRALLKGE
jgi:hypothetical protein